MRVKSSSKTYIRGVAIVLLFAMFHYVAGYRLLYSLGIIYSKMQAKECMADKTGIKKITFSASGYNTLKWTQKTKSSLSINRCMTLWRFKKQAIIM